DMYAPPPRGRAPSPVSERRTVERPGTQQPGRSGDQERRPPVGTCGSPSGSEWDRHQGPPPGPAPTPAANARAVYQNKEDAKTLDDARKAYNGGIKLSKLALAAHSALIDYFPRSGEPKVRINDVTYEE